MRLEAPVILVSASPGELRAAALDSTGRLCDFALARPGAPDGIGDLYRGRMGRHIAAMAGGFVAIGAAVHGFLPDTEGSASLAEGAAVLVRVTRAAQGGKGPRLVLVEQGAAGPMGLVRRGPDAVLRLAAEWPDAPLAVDHPAAVARLNATLPGRVESGPGFSAVLEAELAGLAETTLALPGGAVAHIHPTPALVAIDVDSAAATAHSHRNLNRAGIPELARQIRLRNLSGPILVDLVGQSVRQRKALGCDFRAALAGDPLRPRFLGFSALGMAEILRQRVAPPLHELLSGPHAAGLAALRRLVQDGAAAPEAAFRVRAAPAVVSALEADRAAQVELAWRTGRELIVLADRALAPQDWVVERVP